MKAQLLAKMKNWEAEVLERKCDILQPVIVGVSWWSPDTELDQLNKKLQDFQVILIIEILHSLTGIVTIVFRWCRKNAVTYLNKCIRTSMKVTHE